MNTSTKAILIIGAIFLVIVSSAVLFKSYKQNVTWEYAKKMNTSKAYEEYIAMYPKGKYFIEADSIYKEVLWLETMKKNTFDAYQHYLKKNQYSKYSHICDSICEILLWENAQKTQSNSLFNKYIKFFPNGNYTQEAKSYLDKYLIENCNNWGFDFGNDMLMNNKTKEYRISKKSKSCNVWASDEIYTETWFNIYEKEELVFEVRYGGYSTYDQSTHYFKFLSPKFTTKKFIGVGSPIKDLFIAYPEGKAVYSSGYEDIPKYLHYEVENLKLQFVLGLNSLKDKAQIESKIDDSSAGIYTGLKISDIKDKSKVEAVCYFGAKPNNFLVEMEKKNNEKIYRENGSISIETQNGDVKLYKDDNSFLDELIGEYYWESSGDYGKGGIAIRKGNINVYGSVADILIGAKGSFPNINGGVRKQSICKIDGTCYSDDNKKLFVMENFNISILYMNFANRQFIGEGWETNKYEGRIFIQKVDDKIRFGFFGRTAFTLTKK